jgi:hypothetical protein
MKTFLLTLSLVFSMGYLFNVQAQSLEFSRYIIATDTITDEGVTFEASSDDAEQENDEIDSLFDDDIDAGWEGDPEDFNVLSCGLRFQNICIPKGARIDSAFIVVYSHEAKTAEDVAELTIFGNDVDDAETFTEDALITDRTYTSEDVEWTVAEEWGLWSEERTPDLSNIVQEIVDRDGWNFGNSLAFIIQGENQGASEVENAREFESFENIADPEDGGDGQNKPERVPQLIVYYTVESAELQIPIVATDTIMDEGVTFAASSDDAEQENDEIDSLFDDDIDAGWEGDPEDFNILSCGLRFQNICIPKGARIDSAYIEVHSHEAKTAEDVAELTIYGNKVDDAQTFTENALITDREYTDASIEWTVAKAWGLWSKERTPDVSGIVQELVDRDGWKAGNAIAFIIEGKNQGASEVENAREFESFENIADPEDGGDGQNKPERVPRLYIYYSSPNVTSTKEVFSPVVEPLKVFPNPADETVTVELDTEDAAIIRVFNASGQLMSQQRSDWGKQQQIDVSRLGNGMYYIQALQNGKLYLQKLIVE